jgi:hypothetical protein
MAGWPFAGSTLAFWASWEGNFKLQQIFKKPAIAKTIAGFWLLTTKKGKYE